MSPTIDSAQAANTNLSKNVQGLFGWELHTWEDTMVIFLCIAAAVALIVGLATWQVVRLQRLALKQSEQAFEKYKLDAGQKTAEAMSSAADANARAAEASERAEILKSQLAWRVISEEVANKLTASLAANPGAVNVRYNDGDPEALFLAIQLSNIFGKAKWQVGFGAVKLNNAIAFGTLIPQGQSGHIKTLRKSFSDAGLPFSSEEAPPIGVMFGSTVPDGPMLLIGSKPPPAL